MGAPSVTYESFLETLTDALATEYGTYKLTLEPFPRYRGYGEVKMTICPCEPCIEYVPCESEQIKNAPFTKTSRAYWVDYYARVYVFVALTDKNFEYALKGIGDKPGVVSVLETAYQFLEGNFLALSYLKHSKVIWDRPAIIPEPVIIDESQNMYAAMGSFVYYCRLKQVAETQQQATAPTITNVSSEVTGPYTATITFDTDKFGTSLVKYGTGEWPPDWTDASEETETYQTSHSVELTGLDPDTTHYFKPWSKSKEDWYGQTPIAYSFTTETEDIVFSNFYTTKIFETVQVGWTTNVATKRKIKWRVKGSSLDWTITSLSGAYVLTGICATTIPTTPSKEYEFYPYSITALGYEEWGAMRYLTIDFEGEITVQLAE